MQLILHICILLIKIFVLLEKMFYITSKHHTKQTHTGVKTRQTLFSKYFKTFSWPQMSSPTPQLTNLPKNLDDFKTPKELEQVKYRNCLDSTCANIPEFIRETIVNYSLGLIDAPFGFFFGLEFENCL